MVYGNNRLGNEQPEVLGKINYVVLKGRVLTIYIRVSLGADSHFMD